MIRLSSSPCSIRQPESCKDQCLTYVTHVLAKCKELLAEIGDNLKSREDTANEYVPLTIDSWNAYRSKLSFMRPDFREDLRVVYEKISAINFEIKRFENLGREAYVRNLQDSKNEIERHLKNAIITLQSALQSYGPSE